MTTGTTYYDLVGRPALARDGKAMTVAAKGGKWTAISVSALRPAVNIGEGAFADRFAAWNLPDLDGWFQRRDPARPYDSYAKARRAAFR